MKLISGRIPLLRSQQTSTKRYFTYQPIEESSKYIHNASSAWVFSDDKSRSVIPTYQVMDKDGNITNESEIPDMSTEELLKCYKGMVTISIADDILYKVQRQGKISFHMTAFGEEATHYGTASALDKDDIVYAQYREAGVLFYRGFTIQNAVDQCYGNIRGHGKGRQMPVHFGSKKLNFQTISSPLSTQIPQAAGAGYALRLQGKPNCVICYFGEGAASEGDFHPGLNFASTLSSATIFFCRNNKYAISTPSREQYRGDGIAGRGVAYGIHTIRIDGNDLFAVYNATKKARDIAVNEGRPVLIEAMTYRVGHHSTSDDSSRYRLTSEVEEALERSPIKRLSIYLQKNGLWDEEKQKNLELEAKNSTMNAINDALKQKKPHIDNLFTDVYAELTNDLIEQKEELQEFLRKYGEHYDLDSFSNEL